MRKKASMVTVMVDQQSEIKDSSKGVLHYV